MTLLDEATRAADPRVLTTAARLSVAAGDREASW
jgi:hypothetical protein